MGGSRDQRAAAVRARAAAAPAAPPLRELRGATQWPLLRHVMPPIQPPVIGGRATLWLRDVQLAFPASTSPGIRLVLTQSTYQLQRVLDALGVNPRYAMVADGDDRLRREAAGLRGPWSRLDIVDLGPGAPEEPPDDTDEPLPDVPAAAPALLLHRATAELEARDPLAARASIEEAIGLDPSWEASHFELGKICLQLEDTETAATAFAESVRLMPSFAAAWSNLGAALGELGRGDAALQSLERALEHDPNGFPILNNIGAVHREAGRLDAAEAAFGRVIEVAPTFVFGHYNLGHTLFLQGRFAESCAAYEQGQARDAQRNPRQACRLAVARAAAGDARGALADLTAVADSTPPEVMQELAAEAEETLTALSALALAQPVELGTVMAAVRGYARSG